MPKPLVRGLATRAPVRASVVVGGLPLLELVVEELCTGDDHSVQLTAELPVGDAVGTLDLPLRRGVRGVRGVK